MLEPVLNEKEKVWQDEYLIRSYEVDAQKRAPLPTLCKFMQESAYRHAEHLELGYRHLKEKNQFWVLSRLLIKIDRYPQWGDKIELQTWSTGVEGLFAYRDFQFLDHLGHLLGAARSAWLILNGEKRRPQRLDELKERRDLLTEKRALNEKPGKLPSLTNPGQDSLFLVRFSDLDLYNHVNNARYIQWILDSYPLEMHQKFEVSSFQINFLSEAKFGDEISIHTEPVAGTAVGFSHCLKRREDDQDICRARSQWAPIS